MMVKILSIFGPSLQIAHACQLQVESRCECVAAPSLLRGILLHLLGNSSNIQAHNSVEIIVDCSTPTFFPPQHYCSSPVIVPLLCSALSFSMGSGIE